MVHEELKKARINAGLTMEDAGLLVGLSQSTLSRIEAGDTGISSQRLVDLASAYGVSPSSVLDGSAVRSMSEADIDRMGMVVEFVEETLVGVDPRPAPAIVRDAVVTIFKQETKLAWEAGTSFDPARYEDLLKLMFKKGPSR